MEGRRIYVKHPSYKTSSFQHSGTKGMHWGERLYQYKDGSLTPLGRIHYNIGKARERRIEKAEQKKKAKQELLDEMKKRRYQNEDGTLNARGKLHYRTTDSYKLLSDDELKQKTNRLQLQKNYEQLKKDTSASYRIKTKLKGVAEDAIVSGSKKLAEKIIDKVVDKTVSKILKTDEDNVKKAREFAEKMANTKTSDIIEENKRRSAEAKAYEMEFGKKPPKDYKYSEYIDNEETKPKSSEEKPKEEPKSSEEKPKEEPKPSEEKPKEEPKSSEEKPKEEPKPSEEKPKEEPKETAKDRAIRAYGGKLEKKSDSGIVKIKRDKPANIKKSRVKSLQNSGMTIEEIAERLDVSPSTIEKILKG